MIKSPKLGIIAGGGAAPRQLMEHCLKAGREFFLICLEGQADKDFAKDAPHTWLHFGAGEKLKKTFIDQKIVEAIMIGSVRRPSLLELKPDWLALKVVTKIGINSIGDDGFLRAVAKVIEEESGVRMIGIQNVFSDIIATAGALTKLQPDEVASKDIKRGIEIAKALGKLDVGQAVIVQQGIVLGVEAIEGTDALISRSTGLKREGEGGVLVKLAKPQQDSRFDLPTIGPNTIINAVKAGLRGIAIQSGRSLIVEREKTLSDAEAAGIFVYGITQNEVADG